MDSSRGSGSGFPAPALVILAILLGGIVGQQLPLTSSRPSEKTYLSSKDLRSPVEPQKVEARLWQDPLAAVWEASREDRSLSNLALGDLSNYTKLQVLIVMMSGSPYAEGAEARLRTRYAILSALAEAGYTPQNAQFISYGSWQRKMDNDKKQDINKQNGQEGIKSPLIPFERFDRINREIQASTREGVIVLWINERDFRKHPLVRLLDLRNEIRTLHNEADIRVVGPSDSDMLKDILKECEKSPYSEILIYSPWATAGLEFISSRKHPEKKEDSVINCGKGQIARTHPTDLELSRALLKEFGRRGIDVQKDAIALVHEWDTSYGQALPKAFRNRWEDAWIEAETWTRIEKAALERDMELLRVLKEEIKNDPVLKRKLEDNYQNSVLRFSYLRGLDGELPKAKRNSADQSETTGKTKTESKNGEFRFDRQTLERSEGRHQLDYARRLAKRIVDKNSLLWREGGKRIRAIGVLGSDVYDKLLLLQALRDRFPGTIFFTTDLDTRLLHADEIPWTRNLVVASGFGLRLSKDFQKVTPPFRDSYQTAAFFSTLLALGENMPKNTEVVERCQSDNSCVRIFEIGRARAFDLSPYTASISEKDPRTIHPRRMDLHVLEYLKSQIKKPALYFTLLAVALVIVVFTFVSGIVEFPKLFKNGRQRVIREDRVSLQKLHSSGSVAHALTWIMLLIVLGSFWLVYLFEQSGWQLLDFWDFINPRLFRVLPMIIALLIWGVLLASHANKWACMFWVAAFLLGSCVIVGVITAYDYAADEPFSLAGGVSLWPTEIIRLVIAFLCLYWLLDSTQRLKTSENNLATEFNLGNHGPTEQFRWWHRIFDTADWRTKDKFCFAADLWNEYCQRRSNPYRAWRVTIVAILFFSLALALSLWFGGSHRPFRGDFSRYVDRIVIVFSVSLLLMLMAAVVDANNLARGFIQQLVQRRLPWPDSLYKESSVGVDDWTDWLNIKFIAQDTAVIGRMVIYPFAAMAGMILSRLRYFDQWNFAPILIIIFALMGLLILGTHYFMRRAAQSARSDVVARLKDKLVRVSGNANQAQTKKVQLTELIENVESARQGAFAPLSHNPIVASIMLPSGGYGLVSLINYLSSMS